MNADPTMHWPNGDKALLSEVEQRLSPGEVERYIAAFLWQEEMTPEYPRIGGEVGGHIRLFARFLRTGKGPEDP